MDDYQLSYSLINIMSNIYINDNEIFYKEYIWDICMFTLASLR